MLVWSLCLHYYLVFFINQNSWFFVSNQKLFYLFNIVIYQRKCNYTTFANINWKTWLFWMTVINIHVKVNIERKFSIEQVLTTFNNSLSVDSIYIEQNTYIFSLLNHSFKAFSISHNNKIFKLILWKFFMVDLRCVWLTGSNKWWWV